MTIKEKSLMHNTLFLFFVVTCVSICHGTNDSEPQPQQFYTIVNDNSQKIFVEKKCTTVCCENQHGDALVDCIFSLPIKDQREVFKQLSPTKRREFLRKLDIELYKKFLKAYNEHDWKKLYSNLSEDEKKIWPRTVKEQSFSLYIIKKKSEIHEELVRSTNRIVAFIIKTIYSIPSKEQIEQTGFKEYMELVFEL